MLLDWAEKTAEQLLNKKLFRSGCSLFLGAADTGKTSLISALIKKLTRKNPVAVVDADVGQSHIGPPTTVGWILVDNPQFDFAQLPAKGISFVGDVTPSSHLLQLTSAIIQCVQQASKVCKLILIDTPGFVRGPAASALWWNIQKILQPGVIVAVQRTSELADILTGLKSLDTQLELIKTPQQLPLKSLQDRQSYRQKQFDNYFHNCAVYDVHLTDVALQRSGFFVGSFTNRIVALRDASGADSAIGVVTNLQNDKGVITIKTPRLDIKQIACLVIGDVTINIADE